MITRAQTDREVGSLGSGVAVDVIRPSRDDLDAMGPNLLDGQQRAAVALQAYTTAAERLSR